MEAPRALYAVGQSSEELLNWQTASEAYGKILEKYPKSEEALIAQLSHGTSLHHLGRYAGAVEAFDKILDNPQKYKPEIEVMAQSSKANSLYEMGQYEDAATAYLRVPLVYFNPDQGIVALARAGDSYEKLGRWSDAVLWYRKILRDYAEQGGEYYDQKKSEWNEAIEFARKRLEKIEAIHSPGGDAGEK